MAQEPGTVIAGSRTTLDGSDAKCDQSEPVRKGRVAIAMRAENHAAKRVTEFCRRLAPNAAAVKTAMSVPSTRQYTICTVDAWAIAFRFKAVVIGRSLAPFQDLAQATEFFRIDARLF